MQVELNGELKKTRVLLSQDVIQNRIQALAQQINASYPANETLVILVVLNGALLFAADLIRHLQMPTEIESVRLRSYLGTKSTGTVEILSPLSSLSHKNVLVVEDIIETGRTIDFLIKKLNEQSVQTVRICTLLNKVHEHLIPLHPEYVGFEIGKNFVIGYGFDLDGKYRNLPYIAEVL